MTYLIHALGVVALCLAGLFGVITAALLIEGHFLKASNEPAHAMRKAQVGAFVTIPSFMAIALGLLGLWLVVTF